MERRDFLKLFGGATGAVVATATMAQAGMLAEFMSWLKRAPAWSFPSRTVVEGVPLFDGISAATLVSLRQNIIYDNLFVDSPLMSKLRRREGLESLVGGAETAPPFMYVAGGDFA